MANIKTGVDKLVELISQRKRVSVDDAAKVLGVGKDLVQEWAEFLEEEKVISLDYKLSKVWIVEKKITKDDVIASAREVVSERDAFARRIEVAITSLARETSGFEDVRKQFINIQSHIKSEIETVKQELSELEKYDSLKKTVDESVSRQRAQYDSLIKEAESKLSIQKQRYDDILYAIEKERSSISGYMEKIEELKRLREGHEKSMAELRTSLSGIADTISSYKKKLDDSERSLKQHLSSLDQVEKDLSSRGGGQLLKRFEELKAQHEETLKKQQGIAGQIIGKAEEFKSYSKIRENIHKSFDGFFTKTIDTEKLISEIEKDKEDLQKDLERLKKSVLGFSIVSGSESVRHEMSQIEREIKSQEDRRSQIKSKIERLISVIKGSK